MYYFKGTMRGIGITIGILSMLIGGFILAAVIVLPMLMSIAR